MNADMQRGIGIDFKLQISRFHWVILLFIN